MADEEIDFLHELQEIFLQESAEHIEALESLFLTLEKDHENRAVLDKIFRIMHTIKGSGNAVGFEGLGKFAHICEELLVKAIHKELTVDSGVIDVLLSANDSLKKIHEGLQKDASFSLDTTEITKKIHDILGKTKKSVEGHTYLPQAPAVKAPTVSDGSFGIFDEEEAAPKSAHEDETIQATAVAKKPGEEHGQSGAKDESIRLPLRKIDDILNNFGEQVILQAILEHSLSDLTKNRDLIAKTITNMGKITYDLQQTAIALRMVSLKTFFNQMKRTSRDTSKQLGKSVEFVGIGDDTELDKTIADNLSGVIVHVIRNAIDHGIEAPDIRQAKGKEIQGTLTAQASCEGGYFFLRISDDGAGLDRETLLRKAKEKGLVRADAELTDEEIDNLIFLSGFSTKKEATSVSGRGVGMDAVKVAVEEMHGTITLNTVKDKGSIFTLKLPLSMAIFNGMLLKIAGKSYVVPNSEIKEIYRFGPENVRDIGETDAVLSKGDHTLALISLHGLIGLERPKMGDNKRRIALIVTKNKSDMALEVDDVIGQQRIVQKKLGQEIDSFTGLAGGAILGDGSIALILNINDLMGRYLQSA